VVKKGMNICFFTSLLIALSCHLLIFSFSVIAFPIDPPPHKPKFFFLGPILKHRDVQHIISSNQPKAYLPEFGETTLDRFIAHPLNPNKNPFAIQAIPKPTAQTMNMKPSKPMTKSTFETFEDKTLKSEQMIEEDELLQNIHPYQPLQFRSK